MFLVEGVGRDRLKEVEFKFYFEKLMGFSLVEDRNWEVKSLYFSRENKM